MSACIVLSPMVLANWPMLRKILEATARSAGFALVENEAARRGAHQIQLDLENVDVVSASLSPDQELVVSREGVRVVFRRDARGHFQTCVSGALPKEELRRIGEDLAGQVVQQYVYQRLTSELRNQGFVLVREESGPDQSIHLQVRRYE